MLRRIVTAALAVALMGGSAGGYQASWQKESRAALDHVQLVHHREGPCSQIHWRLRPRPERADEIRAAVRRLIRCAVRRWPVSGGAPQALSTFDCESGFWPFAVGGDNLGVTQQKDDYWPGRAHKYLRQRWFGPRLPAPYGEPGDRRLALNARANIIVGIRMAHESGWGAWSCA